MAMKSIEIRVEGIVQGVGFRPFIYRVATRLGLYGYVWNDTEGVMIAVSGKEAELKQFIKMIEENPPPLAVINSVSSSEVPFRNYVGFKVEKSRVTSKKSTFIPPDTALCKECRSELSDPNNRRFHYGFTTCTHCGPRFSIISNIPYDRGNTAMSPFELCLDCREEYENPSDRRFHTEPTSCSVCGPSYFLKDRDGNILSEDIDEIISGVAEALSNDKIVAMKGVGGFHLAVNAMSDSAVNRLRTRKKRPFKPFAVMAGNIESLENFLFVSKVERELLLSKERPIVIMKRKREAISALTSPGITFSGAMLPYSPLQILLFEKLEPGTVLIMTSGNISDEPIIFDENNLFEKLGNIADIFVTSNREIIQQTDDSVMFTVKERPFFIRRSRGFVPVPFFSERTGVELFASGADLKNSFAVAKEDKVFLSQYIGDLESPLTEKVFKRTVDHYKKIFDITPEVYISDMHPNYFSSKIADKLGKGKKRLKVQHHHAHIASVLEENEESGKVIGIAFDGTGYGSDGRIWGSEFLIADKKSFKRAGHFEYFRLPGGEAAIKEVWRIAHSLKFETFGAGEHGKNKKEDIITELLVKNINSPFTCSVGRLFDGISSILGLSDVITSEAEAAQLLEEAAMRSEISGKFFPVNIIKKGDEYIIRTTDFVRGVFSMMEKGIERDEIASSFHLSIVESSIQLIEMLRRDSKIDKLALSGGVFQNRLLLSLFMEELEKRDFKVLLPKKLPFNDGCIAFGQIAVAKALLK